MRTFTVVWLGQLLSLWGSGMTRFALFIWAYQQTEQAGTVALLGFFAFIPMFIASPIAGVFIDRLDRRLVMLFSDLLAGLMTVIMFVLYVSGNLQIWHLYALSFMAGLFESFQAPAYSAAVTTLVPRSYLPRANGMRSMALSASEVFAPISAGLVLAIAGIGGVMLIDIATFIFAVTTLVVVRFPDVRLLHKDIKRDSFWKEVQVGFRFIFADGGLMWLLFLFAMMNLLAAITYYSILPAMVLGRTGNDEAVLVAVQSALGVGGFIGGAFISAFGLPKPYIRTLLISAVLTFSLGDLLLGLGKTPIVWIAAGFFAALFIPPIVSAAEVIWQLKTPAEIQGKVFSVRRLFSNAVTPIGYLLAGFLADSIFEPAMQAGGALQPLFSELIGTGAGTGISVMFLITGTCGVLVGVSGYFIRAVRTLETDNGAHDEIASLSVDIA